MDVAENPSGMSPEQSTQMVSPMNFSSRVRSWSLAALLASLFVAMAEQEASAQVLLAQGGAAKTGIGYGLVLLAMILGLVVVLRPNKRKVTEKKGAAPAAKKK